MKKATAERDAEQREALLKDLGFAAPKAMIDLTEVDAEKTKPQPPAWGDSRTPR